MPFPWEIIYAKTRRGTELQQLPRALYPSRTYHLVETGRRKQILPTRTKSRTQRAMRKFAKLKPPAKSIRLLRQYPSRSIPECQQVRALSKLTAEACGITDHCVSHAVPRPESDEMSDPRGLRVGVYVPRGSVHRQASGIVTRHGPQCPCPEATNANSEHVPISEPARLLPPPRQEVSSTSRVCAFCKAERDVTAATSFSVHAPGQQS